MVAIGSTNEIAASPNRLFLVLGSNCLDLQEVVVEVGCVDQRKGSPSSSVRLGLALAFTTRCAYRRFPRPARWHKYLGSEQMG